MTDSDDNPTDPKALRQRADHFRELGMGVDDARARAAAKELADQYEALAAELEARDKSRVEFNGGEKNR